MKSDELQQLDLASLGGCSWEYDLETDRITYSAEFFDLLGYRADELAIDTDWVSDNIHPADLSQWRDAFIGAVKGTRKYFDCELRYRHKDDHYVWIQTRGVVDERDNDGKALSINGVVFDISQRKTAKENESRYRLFLDNIPDAISLKDQAGRYLYINRQFEAWIGKPSYQIYGQTADQIFESDYSELSLLREHESKVWQSGRTISMERSFPRTEDGKTRHAMITKYPIFDETGNMLGIGTTNTDISTQYRAQEAIRLSEQRYRRLFESAPTTLAETDWSRGKALIASLREQGIRDLKQYLIDNPELTRRQDQVLQVLNVNHEALQIYRSDSAEELIAYAGIEVSEELRVGLIEDLMTFDSGQRRSTFRGKGYRVDGEEFPLIRVSEMYGSDPDDWSQVLLSIRDSSAEEAVRMSEIRFRRLFESAPAALYETDWSKGKQLVDRLLAEGVEDIRQYLIDHPSLIERRDDIHTILDANAEAVAMYRSRDKESHVQFINAELIDEQRQAMIEVLYTFATGKRRSLQRTSTMRESGELFPIVCNCELISSKREDWSLVLVSVQDMSVEAEAAHRLEVYQEELRSLAGKISLAEESERRRISSELHDGTIQNLVLARIHLANLKNSLEMEATRELAGSIDTLLESSLKETRSLIFEISPPVLYELGLEPAVEWLAEHYKQRTGVDVKITSDAGSASLPEDLNIVLFQSARELLVNIAKHAQAKNVSVNWKHGADFVVLTVKDDGIGFDVDSPRVRLATRGGFGLFALRERLKLLGAEIDIESSGQGTRVSITAPINAE